MRGTPYRLNFVDQLLTARFAAVLKRFYFLSIISRNSAKNTISLMYFSYGNLFYREAPLNVEWRRHNK